MLKGKKKKQHKILLSLLSSSIHNQHNRLSFYIQASLMDPKSALPFQTTGSGVVQGSSSSPVPHPTPIQPASVTYVIFLLHRLKAIILVPSSYNTNTINWEAYKNRNLFLTVLDAGKSKIKAPARLETGESPLPGSQSSHCVLTWQKGQRGSLGSSL